MATVDDLANYDAIIVGSPTRFGRPASQMAAFLDQPAILRGRRVERQVGGAFPRLRASTATGNRLDVPPHQPPALRDDRRRAAFSAATMGHRGTETSQPQDLEGARVWPVDFTHRQGCPADAGPPRRRSAATGSRSGDEEGLVAKDAQPVSRSENSRRTLEAAGAAMSAAVIAPSACRTLVGHGPVPPIRADLRGGRESGAVKRQVISCSGDGTRRVVLVSVRGRPRC